MVRKERRGVRVHPMGLQESEYLIKTTNNQRDASIRKQYRENGPRTRRLSTTVIVESNDHDHKCGVCQAKLSASEVYNNTTQNGTKTLAPLCCKNCSTLKPESREGVEVDDGFDLWKSMKISRNPFHDMSQNTRKVWWDSLVEKKMNFLTSIQNYNIKIANDVDIEKKSNNVEDSLENKDLNDVTSTSDQRETKEEATIPKSDDKTNGGSMSKSLRARSKSPVQERGKRSSLKLKVHTLKPVRPRSLSPRRKESTAMGNQESAKNFSMGEKKTLSFGTTTVKFFNPETLPSQILDAQTFSIGQNKIDSESDDTLVGCQPTAFPISPLKIRRDPTPLHRKVSPPKAKRTPTSKVAAVTRIFVAHKPSLSSPQGVASRRAGSNDDKLSTIHPTKITIAENMDRKKKTRVMKSISPFFFKTDLAVSEHGAESSTKDVKKTHQLLCTSSRKPIDAAAIAKRSPSKGKTRKATIPRAHASSPDTNLAPQYKLIPAPNLAKMDASQRRSHFGIANAASLYELKAEQLIIMAEECQSEGLISGSVVFGKNTKELDLVKFMRKNVFEF